MDMDMDRLTRSVGPMPERTYERAATRYDAIDARSGDLQFVCYAIRDIPLAHLNTNVQQERKMRFKHARQGMSFHLISIYRTTHTTHNTQHASNKHKHKAQAPNLKAYVCGGRTTDNPRATSYTYVLIDGAEDEDGDEAETRRDETKGSGRRNTRDREEMEKGVMEFVRRGTTAANGEQIQGVRTRDKGQGWCQNVCQ